MKRELIASGLAALTAVAIGGWLRPTAPAPAPDAPAAAVSPAFYGVPAPYGSPQLYSMNRAAAPAPTYPGPARAIYRRPVRVHRTSYAARGSADRYYEPAAVRRGRPLSHSIAIVAGGAGAGAAIGALAGGGKGAAIGALAGGGAGLVYDRLTHKRATYSPVSHSFRRSLLTTGGGAGAGAAIGALTGGSRGALIGALTGSGAGLLYDRLAHR